MGEQYDAPNQQAVGLDPPWVEGTGGGSDKPDKPMAADGEEESDDTSDLDQMTKQELLDHARSLGVSPANNDMTKEELRAGIDSKNAEEGGT